MTQKPPSRTLAQYIVRLPDGLRDRIKALAAEKRTSMNAMIVEALEEKFGGEAVVESLPQEMRDRLEAGESRVRVFREFRGMTRHGLAEAAGIKPMMIHNIERGMGSGSLNNLLRIAEALDVTIDDLV